MSPDATLRSVMVRNQHLVPALPDELLRRPDGSQVSPRVELVELIFEYWDNSGATRRQVRSEMLNLLATSGLEPRDMADLVHILYVRNRIASFVDLARRSVDEGALWRRALEERGFGPDEMRFYGSNNGLDLKAFTDGFFLGVGQSFATVIFDLPSLVKLVIDANAEFNGALLQLLWDRSAATARLWAPFELALQAARKAFPYLNPARWPASAKALWSQWNEKFADALERSDSFEAGRLLGELAGMLWQLLTALLGLIKLLRVTAKAAVRYAPLALTSLRRTTALVSQALADITEMLLVLGETVINALPKVGMQVLRLLFGQRLCEALIRDAKAFAAMDGWTLSLVPQPCFQAASMASIKTPIAVIATHEGRPIFMTAIGERAALPSSASDELDVVLDRVFSAVDNAPKSWTGTASDVEFARRALLTQRMDAELEAFVMLEARSLFHSLRRANQKILPQTFGIKFGQELDNHLAGFVSRIAPDVDILTSAPENVLTMDKLVNVLAERRLLSAEQVSSAREILKKPVYIFLHENRDILAAMDVEDIALHTEEDILKYVRKRWRYGANTTAGSLKPDAVLLDAKLRRVDILDWTSDGSFLRFEDLTTEMIEKVENATGQLAPQQFDDLMASYRQLSPEQGPPIEVLVASMRQHAERETVLRNAILARITGPGWYTRVQEIFYENINKLFKAN